MAQAQNKPQPVYSVRHEGDGYTVFRDAEALKTPRTLPVSVPTSALAEAIKAEAEGQGEKLDLRQMPMTQMALTAIDISTHHRTEVIDGLMRYGDTELVCQHATEPAELVAAQNEGWKPWINWCEKKFNVDLRQGTGISPFSQKAETLDALRGHVDTFDSWRLTGLSEAVGVSGSLVLGLALAEGAADVEAVFQAAELDGLWQMKKWGSDPATDGRQADIRRDLDVCARWFHFLG